MKTIWEIIKIDPRVRKAGVALYTTLATGIGTSMADGNLTSGEVVVTLGAALIATAGVFQVSNDD